MDRDKIDEKDFLAEYINPGKIEKAPNGFTEKILDELQKEQVNHAARRGIIRSVSSVPVISVLITLILFILAFIFLSPSDQVFGSDFFRSVQKIELTLPDINLDSLVSFTLPAIIFYLLIGFFTLTIFDRLLNRLFRR